MAVITFGNNLASLNAQRRLTDSSKALRTSFERLSSGLRINHASDDAAGLSIANGLNTDARVFTQGIRNINDGTSLLNIADGALTELENVAIRLGELTEQASNGTISNTQRQSLNTEANALVNEYNRIAGSTSFNNVQLLDGSFGQLDVQAGYGQDGKISFGLGSGLSRYVWGGTFSAEKTYPSAAFTSASTTGDFNNDGKADIIGMDDTGNVIRVLIGNGDGTFNRALTQTATAVSGVVVVDVNNDNTMDLISGTKNAGGLNIYLGNGDGTFSYATSLATGNASGQSQIRSADINGDGKADFVVTDSKNNGSLQVYLGNGNGTFLAPTSFGDLDRAEFLDYNSDGKLDLISGLAGSGFSVRLGNGDGTFRAAQSLNNFGTSITQIVGNDLNGDGLLDYYVNRSASANVYLANGDGTYKVSAQINGTGYLTRFADFDNDGVTDVITYNDVFIGNGDGTFRVAVHRPFSGKNISGIADFNSDGTMDVLGGAQSGTTPMGVKLSVSTLGTTAPTLNISAQQWAKNSLSIVRNILNRVVAERSNIGAQQARLQTSLSNLSQTRENIVTASSRILDADIAEESATLVKNKILQQAGLAVLAQANSSPELALSLLSTSSTRRR